MFACFLYSTGEDFERNIEMMRRYAGTVRQVLT